MNCLPPGDTRILGRLQSIDGTGVVLIQDRFDADIEDLAAHLVAGGRCDAQVRWAELICAYQQLTPTVTSARPS